MQKKGEKHPLTKPQHQLLLSLVHSRNKQSRKVFDKKGNCFTNKSLREIEKVTTHSKSSLGRLFKVLNDRDLTRTVANHKGEAVTMLSPLFMPCTTHHLEKRCKLAVYALGSYKKACEWSDACRANSVIYDLDTFTLADIIDFETGEVTPQRKIRRALTQFELREWERYRHSYSCTDRTKHRPPKRA